MGCSSGVSKEESKKWDIVYEYLNESILPWYSINIKTFCEMTNLSRKELNNITYPNGKYVKQFRKQFNDDWINVFTFKNVTYVGTESRRKDYERDKNNNDNFVEDRIKIGLYDKRRSIT